MNPPKWKARLIALLEDDELYEEDIYEDDDEDEAGLECDWGDDDDE